MTVQGSVRRNKKEIWLQVEYERIVKETFSRSGASKDPSKRELTNR